MTATLIALLIAGLNSSPATTSLAVGFDVDLAEQPAHVCVITGRGTRRLGRDGKEIDYSVALSKVEGALQVESASTARPDDHTGRRFDSKALSLLIAGLDGEALQDVRTAFDGLKSVSDSEACTASYSACAPLLWTSATRERYSRFPKKHQSANLYVTCSAKNAAAAGPAGRILFLSLDLIHGEDLPVEEIRLDGTAASVVLSGASNSSDKAVVRVVGGHYLPGRSYLTDSNHVVLPLRSICASKRVRLPSVNRISAELNEVTLSQANQPIRSCIPSVSGNEFGMLLAQSEGAAEYALEARAGGHAILRTHWTATPPETPLLALESMTVRWQPDCTYRLAAGCPSLRVDGISCAIQSAAGADSCAYRCETSANFVLPAIAEMEAGAQHWKGELHYPDETLTDYVDSAQTSLSIEFPGWRKLPFIERSHLQEVDLTLPSGETHPVDISFSLEDLNFNPRIHELRAPRFNCGTAIKVSYKGDVVYDDHSVDVVHGLVSVPNPACRGLSAFCFGWLKSVGVAVGTRPFRAGLPAPSYASGIYLTGKYFSDVTSWGSYWFARGGTTVILGTREYIADEGDFKESRSAAYGRVGYEASVGLRSPNVSLIPEFRLSGGITVGYGHVLDFGMPGNIGGSLFYAPHLMLQVDRFSLLARLMLGEGLPRIDTRTAANLGDFGSRQILYEVHYSFK